MAKRPDLVYLRPYAASETQAERLEAVIEHGSHRAAAEALGLKRHSQIDHAISAMKKRAAKAGHAPGHFNDGTAPGYRMGKVTIQRGPAGVERVWERQHPDDIDWSEAFERIASSLQDGIKPAPVRPAPQGARDMLAVIPIGDPHFGSYSWAGDTGESYDLDIARSLHIAGVRELLRATGKVKHMVLLNLGDMFDSNCSKNRTPRSGHVMDAVGTYDEILEAAVHSMLEMIELALQHAETVEVPTIEGNHDPEACAALSAFIYGRYGNHPRVICRLKPFVYWYKRWNKVLLGSHHGHGCKPDSLPILMANDRRADWGETKHGYWLIGHYHHKQKFGGEHTGAYVEGFNTLAANNKHHYDEGYRGTRSITSILFDPEHGEWERHVRNVEAIEAAA